MVSLSVVIPVYNAERTIGELSRQLVDMYGSRFRLEIVLVNDGSTDRSDEVCRGVHARFPDHVRYIRLSRNFGEHPAVMAGLNHATGDWCVVMDDDFQNPPEEVAILLDEMAKGFDVVYAQYAAKRDGFFRNMGSRLHNWMAVKALGKPVDLYLCSFKAMNRFVVNNAKSFKGPDPYLDALILRTTDSIGKVTVRHAQRRVSVSGYTFRRLLALWGTMVVAFSMLPIRLVGLAGLVILAIGTFMMAADTFRALVSPDGEGPSDVESLRALLVFLRGITLFLLSIMAEYIGRIAARFSDAPQFIVREVLAPKGPVPAEERAVS